MALDTLDGNMLLAGGATPEVSLFRRRLAAAIAARGFPLRPKRFRFHVTLDYGPAPQRRLGIPPISWWIEEFLLVKSVHTRGHVELGRWPLIRRQLEFAFEEANSQL